MSVHEMGIAVVGAGFIGPVRMEALGRMGLPMWSYTEEPPN